jgi:hypothetical protein
MRSYNPAVIKLFDSLSPNDRDDLRAMLDLGVTRESAADLLREGLNRMTEYALILDKPR